MSVNCFGLGSGKNLFGILMVDNFSKIFSTLQEFKIASVQMHAWILPALLPDWT